MSSNNEYAIQVQDVSKIYKLYDKPIDRLKESLSLTHKNYHKDFFALSDISFNVKKGETVGIIGTNGSGDEKYENMFLIHSQIFYNCKVHQGRNLHYL